jgi:putative DNA primase/helicase
MTAEADNLVPHSESILPTESSQNVEPEHIPDILKNYPQWVCWRYEIDPAREKPMKVPYSPHRLSRARVQDASTWGSFEDAWGAYDEGTRYDGIGFVLTKEDNIVGVDIDSCVSEDGTLTETAQAVVGLLDSYTEWSPSGKGLRIFVQADLKEFAGKRRPELELYNFGRYLTVTGHHLPGLPESIEQRLEELRELYRFFFSGSAAAKQLPTEVVLPEKQRILPGDDNLVLDRMFSGGMGNLYHEIYHGVTSGVWSNGAGGAPDESRADVLLFNALAYYTGQDASAMRRILLASPRAIQRMAKWNKRVKDGLTYLEYQIQDSIHYTYSRR